MATRQSSSKLAEIAKNPAAYVLVLVAGLIGAILRGDGKDGTRAGDYKEQLQACQLESKKKDERYEALVNRFLIKQGVVDAVGTIADSTAQTH